jgi:hypothetical protein
MPNWCENDLHVSGPEADLKDFLAYARGKDGEGEPTILDFTKFIPIPEGTKNEAEWCRRHWGTRTDPQDARLDDDEVLNECCIKYETAWTPALGPVLAMSARFPGLEFELKYREPNEAYHGRYCCEGGKVTYDKSGEYFG